MFLCRDTLQSMGLRNDSSWKYNHVCPLRCSLVCYGIFISILGEAQEGSGSPVENRNFGVHHYDLCHPQPNY